MKVVVIVHSSTDTDRSSTSEQRTLLVSLTLPAGREMVMPGDNVELNVDFISPIAMEKDLRFAIREGGRTVGSGVVTEIIRLIG